MSKQVCKHAANRDRAGNRFATAIAVRRVAKKLQRVVSSHVAAERTYIELATNHSRDAASNISR